MGIDRTPLNGNILGLKQMASEGSIANIYIEKYLPGFGEFI